MCVHSVVCFSSFAPWWSQWSKGSSCSELGHEVNQQAKPPLSLSHSPCPSQNLKAQRGGSQPCKGRKLLLQCSSCWIRRLKSPGSASQWWGEEVGVEGGMVITRSRCRDGGGGGGGCCSQSWDVPRFYWRSFSSLHFLIPIGPTGIPPLWRNGGILCVCVCVRTYCS